LKVSGEISKRCGGVEEGGRGERQGWDLRRKGDKREIGEGRGTELVIVKIRRVEDS
jgi:hypothetical protein